MGKKRTSDGEEKPSKAARASATHSKKTRSGAQATKSSDAPSTTNLPPNPPKQKKQKLDNSPNPQSNPKQPQSAAPQRETRKKMQKLPPNASISKRPLHHPAIPTPFSSASQPKVIYLTHSTPFVPTLKRIRRLLLEISKRQAQSEAALLPLHRRHNQRYRKPLEANGRLAPEDVEREIAEAGREKEGVGGEEVFVKATGRAIERALGIGVHFQGESDCRVRVEMGSVMAVDDIEVRDGEEDGGQVGDEDVPETRIRMVSSVTVAVGLK